MEKNVVSSKKLNIIWIPIVATVFSIGCFLYPVIYELRRPGFKNESLWYNLDYSTSLDDIMWPIAICLFVIVWALYLIISKSEISVTDKRVFGRTLFGKRVDLPMDSVSAVGTSLLHGISVSTASGAIRFFCIKNNDEIHKAISDLLLVRQSKPKAEETTIKQEIPQSNADELKKFKDLLDSGVITQEEFDAKKKQLLGL